MRSQSEAKWKGPALNSGLKGGEGLALEATETNRRNVHYEPSATLSRADICSDPQTPDWGEGSLLDALLGPSGAPADTSQD